MTDNYDNNPDEPMHYNSGNFAGAGTEKIINHKILTSNERMKKVTVGILGCANIARKNIRAIKKSRNCIL